MKKNNSYFKIYRSLLANDLWLNEPFTHGQAWVDLIGLANFDRREKFFKGEFQIVKRGQIVSSYKFFENRWKWSRNKVKRFFLQLSVMQMIQVESTKNGTTITIENYGIYQGREPRNGTTDEPTNERAVEPTVKPHNNNYKNSKKEEGSNYVIEVINGVEVARLLNGL